MIKYKCIWLGSLAALLGAVYLLFWNSEASSFGGVRILAYEELMQLAQGKSCMENPSEVGGVLCIGGNNVAYDETNHTYYVSHSIEEDTFGTLFSLALSDCEIYLEDTQAWGDLTDAMQEGHSFRIWFVAEDAYAICNMIFTGVPVMAVHCAERVSREYGSGEMVLFDPEDEEIGGLSARTSSALIKKNPNSGTYSIKLMKKTLDEEKKLSLLGMGKNNNWKLYKVSENDGTLMRAILASEVWNIINMDTKLQREYQFVELIVNNRYEGLYLLTPKWTKAFLDVGDEYRLHQPEEVSKDELARLWNSMDVESLSRYALFLQTTYAFKNTSEDYIILERVMEGGEPRCVLFPDKLEFAFGGFNHKLNYLSWNDTSHMLLSYKDMGIDETLWIEEIFPLCCENWNWFRSEKLETARLLKSIQDYKDYIVRSGLAKRCVLDDMYGYYYGRFEQYIIDRMEYLDEYFENRLDALQFGTVEL